jgi:hypothetical protein
MGRAAAAALLEFSIFDFFWFKHGFLTFRQGGDQDSGLA